VTAPLKVLHLIPTLMSGGAERQLVNVIGSTSKDVVTHIVCVIDDASFFGPDVTAAGYPLIELGINKKRPFFKAAWRFRKVIAEQRPDLIHSWLYDANIVARLASFPSRRIPIVTSLQLADYEPEAARIGSWNPYKVLALRKFDQITFWLARPYFVACSEFVRHSYERYLGLDTASITVIYNSVDPDALNGPAKSEQELRMELGLPKDAFVYLNVGRLDAQKNHRVLLEAFRTTCEVVSDAYLLLAGQGPLEASLKQYADDLGIGKKVQFLGPRDDVGALLTLADVFVFPSLFEGLPVALVEAMFFSLPCIASQIEVFQEVIDDRLSGLLVDPRSPINLSEAMTELYNDPALRASLGGAAYDVVSRGFRSSHSARQWEELYQRLSGQA
jgi:glycosyltransferase involved in cell wall biosynthesis